MQSPQRIGPQAWHHLALAVSQEETSVYLNGVRQGTFMAHSDPLGADLQLAPRQGPFEPFRGDLDELVALPFFTSEAFWSREEPYLVFRGIVLRDLQELDLIQQADELRAPTYEGTARLRAYVHSLFTRQVATSTLLDPLSISWNDEGIEGYVFSGPTLPEFDPRLAPGSLFLGIRSGQRNGYCGAASLILRSLYKAFGYEPQVRDFIHRNGKDTHVLVEVKILETGTWVFQDPTYDLGGGDFTRATPRYVGLDGLIALSRAPLSTVGFPFQKGTYFPEAEEPQAWSFAQIGSRFYLGYFHQQARVYPPELR
jgi:hypothetical protein